jgi:NTE family protein
MTPEQVALLPRPLAFVLPGGGALGSYQVGVLRALTHAGIEPDLLIGVSAGAVNAALFAWNSGADGLLRMEAIWRGIRRRDLMRVHPGRMALAFAGRRPSFLDNRHGHSFLQRHLGNRLVEHSPIRLALVATDLTTGAAVPILHGNAALAVLASTAFPGVYPPVELDGRTLIDGGVVADVPLDVALELGAASALVLSVPPLSTDETPRRAIDILFRASSLGVEAHGRSLLQRPPPGVTVVEVIAPPSPLTTFSVGRSAFMIEEGQAAASRWLQTDARAELRDRHGGSEQH